MNNLTENQKRDFLKELFSQTHSEISRYRDLEWKIAYWTIALLAGITAATQFIGGSIIAKPYVQTLLTIVTVIISIYGIWHIHFIHKSLTWNRKLRIKCEHLMGMFEDGEYGSDSLLPKSFATSPVKYSEGIGHLVSWWSVIILTMFYTIYSVVYIKVI